MFLNGLGVAAYFSKELNAMVEQKLDHMRARHDRYAKVAALSHVDSRIVQLETALARSLLLVEALTETCVSKGVLTRDEISQRADLIELDRVSSFAEETTEEVVAASPEEYFHRLEERDRREAEEVESAEVSAGGGCGERGVRGRERATASDG